jgi:RNA polymerase sigma-70 factor (ECF subfamily)
VDIALVTPLKFVGDERALVEALRSRHPGAVAVLYERHAGAVHRTLRSALGPDADLPDLVQEVFIRALDSIAQLEDHERLRSWLRSIAVFTARALIRQRARRKWLSLFSPQRTVKTEQEPPCSEARFALREVYALLDELPVDQRLAFVLRIIDGMTLPDAAEACGVSLATFKRRLARAERAFVQAAEGRPLLAPWLKEGTRWSHQKQR